jgi:hypothetical protein
VAVAAAATFHAPHDIYDRKALDMIIRTRISTAKLVVLMFATICGLAVLCAVAAPSANASTSRNDRYPGSVWVTGVARCSDGMFTSGLQRYMQTPTFEVGLSPQYSNIAQVVTMQTTVYYKDTSDNYALWKNLRLPTQKQTIGAYIKAEFGGQTVYDDPGEFDTLVTTLTWTSWQTGAYLGSTVLYFYNASDYTIEPSRTIIQSAYIGSIAGCWFRTLTAAQARIRSPRGSFCASLYWLSVHQRRGD